jgi:hypothetical protein
MCYICISSFIIIIFVGMHEYFSTIDILTKLFSWIIEFKSNVFMCASFYGGSIILLFILILFFLEIL